MWPATPSSSSRLLNPPGAVIIPSSTLREPVRDEVVVSFLAADHVQRLAGDSVEVPGVGRVFKVVGLFGPNASGKSTVLAALDDLSLAVASGVAPGRKREEAHAFHDPFLLESAQLQQPTRWEVVVWAGGRLWTYKLSIGPDHVHGESLSVGVPGQEVPFFSRLTEPGRTVVRWGDGAPKGKKRRQFLAFVAEGCRPEQPLLAELRDRNVLEVEPLTDWFAELDNFDEDQDAVLFATAHAAMNPDLAPWMTDFLAAHDRSIDNVTLDGEPGVGGRTFAHAMAAATEGDLRLTFRPLSSDGATFDASLLSSGTRQLVGLAPAWRDLVCGHPALILVDELDKSLHKAVSRRLIRAVHQAAGPGQLFFSSHDTRLIDRSLLAPDAVWFVDKSRDGVSRLYSLAEFNPDQLGELGDGLDLGYLDGRFGAIPRIGPLLVGEP